VANYTADIVHVPRQGRAFGGGHWKRLTHHTWPQLAHVNHTTGSPSSGVTVAVRAQHIGHGGVIGGALVNAGPRSVRPVASRRRVPTVVN